MNKIMNLTRNATIVSIAVFVLSTLPARAQLIPDGEYYIINTYGSSESEWNGGYLSWDKADDKKGNATIEKDDAVKWKFVKDEGRPDTYWITSAWGSPGSTLYGAYLSWDRIQNPNKLNATVEFTDPTAWKVVRASASNIYKIINNQVGYDNYLDWELSWDGRTGTYPAATVEVGDPVAWAIIPADLHKPYTSDWRQRVRDDDYIDVNPLPATITFKDGTSLRDLSGFVAKVDLRNAEIVVPNSPMVESKTGGLCYENNRYGITPYSKDNNNKPYESPLYTLDEWHEKMRMKGMRLMVNANWFYVDSDIAMFPHIVPCTNILGPSLSGNSLVSSSKTKDRNEFLDALVFREGLGRIIPSTDLKEKDDDLWSYDAAVGGFIIVENGQHRANIPGSTSPDINFARTAIGLSEDEHIMYVVVEQNGKFNDIKNGFNARQLGEYIMQLGAYNVINLDNSGSSQFLFYDLPGDTRPFFQSLPGDIVDCDILDNAVSLGFGSFVSKCTQAERDREKAGQDVHRYRPIPNFLGVRKRLR